MEIILDSKQTCNLSNTNMLAFVDDNGVVDYDGLYRAMELSARVGLRTTCVTLELPQWDMKQKRDRLLGVGLSGIFDFMDMANLNEEEMRQILAECKRRAIVEANKYAKELGINEPLLVTTIKPSGSSSQLYGESAGAHRGMSKFFIRRVRIASNDPLVKVCEELGYKIEPEVGQDWDTCTTKVVEFYAKSKGKRFKRDVSAVEQLQNYIMLQEEFTAHNTSITVHIKEDEWEDAERFVYDNWDKMVAVSFIPLDDSFYQLLPYEEITEDEYLEKSKSVKRFDQSLLSKYEFVDPEDDLGADSECSGSICAIR
jgi:adenosylcobalamin-dependent ribonucleoside-triphosphate reductase